MIRYDAATREELDREVTLEIDGQKVVVKKAVLATDEHGKLRYDEDGEVIPRPTTIYDAVSQAVRESSRATARIPARWSARRSEPEKTRSSGWPAKANNPIPILCHTSYMDPVAVCRVCVVQLARFRRRTGKVEVDDKLLPACQHRVEDEMIVDTIASPDAERQAADRELAVKTLIELLMTDHPTPCVKEQQNPGDCELEALARRFGVDRAAVRAPGGRASQGRLVAGHRRRPQRLHPLRPLRARLRRHQGKPRHRPHGQGLPGADRL